MPVLVIWGEATMALDLICLQGIEKYVTDLTVKRLPGISYWVQQGATEAVNAPLGGFPGLREAIVSLVYLVGSSTVSTMVTYDHELETSDFTGSERAERVRETFEL